MYEIGLLTMLTYTGQSLLGWVHSNRIINLLANCCDVIISQIDLLSPSNTSLDLYGPPILSRWYDPNGFDSLSRPVKAIDLWKQPVLDITKAHRGFEEGACKRLDGLSAQDTQVCEGTQSYIQTTASSFFYSKPIGELTDTEKGHLDRIRKEADSKSSQPLGL